MNLRSVVFTFIFILLCSVSFTQPTHASERENEIAAKNSYQRAITQFCRGKPIVDAYLQEVFANRLRVNPDSISLNRVEVLTKDLIYAEINGFVNRTDGSNKYSYCLGIFYSPGGSFECQLSFNQNNVIVNGCDVIKQYKSHTDMLFSRWASLYAANSVSSAPRQSSCGTNKYCYDSSGRPAGERNSVTCKCPGQ